MRLCSHCHRREAEGHYRKCEPCRDQNNRAARAYYARHHQRWPPTPYDQALVLLTTFVMTPRELSCALDISIAHASNTLRRLWEKGHCVRWPYRDRSYRYRLRDAA